MNPNQSLHPTADHIGFYERHIDTESLWSRQR